MHKIKFKKGNVKEFETLSDSYLSGANLSGAYLIGTNLSGTDLIDTDLSGADLRGANLRVAYLNGANLRDANLSGADLRGANLSGADLSGVNLRGADLRDAHLNFTRGIILFSVEVHTGIYYCTSTSHRLKLGCQDYPIDYWLKNYRAIGEAHGYSQDTIEAYGDFIKLVSKYEIRRKGDE